MSCQYSLIEVGNLLSVNLADVPCDNCKERYTMQSVPVIYRGHIYYADIDKIYDVVDYFLPIACPNCLTVWRSHISECDDAGIRFAMLELA